MLLPQLLKQNDLQALDLSWSEKKDRILPQLLPTAETLMLALGAEYHKQLGERPDEKIDRKLGVGEPSLQVELPARAGAPLRTLVLERPSLTLGQLESVLEPFLDPDLLFPRDTEINPVSSVFAPVSDALRRANLGRKDIDAVLPVGGSSLIPQVQKALASHFQGAAQVRFPDDDHALQRGGFVELIPRGSELPFPPNGGLGHFHGLVVPKDLMGDVQIVVAEDGPSKVLGIQRLELPELRSAGEPIDLRFKPDANKMLVVEAFLSRSRRGPRRLQPSRRQLVEPAGGGVRRPRAARAGPHRLPAAGALRLGAQPGRRWTCYQRGVADGRC